MNNEKITDVAKTTRFEKAEGFDLQKSLLQDGIIPINGEINDNMAMMVTMSLLYYNSLNPNGTVHLYINSPGGSVSAGMAIYDTMQSISCEVETIAVGMAASMGAVLLSGGTKGMRRALPHASVMIHQPLGGAQGQATEIEIAAKHILDTKEMLNQILADNCNMPYEEMCQKTERDYWLNAKEALDLGIIDQVIM